MTNDVIKTFVKERDEALLSGDIQTVKEHFAKWNPGLKFGSDEIAELAMHKAITGCLSLPLEYRRKSKAWLDERGSSSLDDGDL